MTRHKDKRRQTGTPPQRLDVHMDEVAAALARARALISAEDHALLSRVVDTLAWVTAEFHLKTVSIDRLRKMIFGASSEKTSDVLSEDTVATGVTLESEVPAAEAASPPMQDPATPRPKAPGHGRNGAAAYTGATQVSVAHPDLHGGESCPGCTSGKLYPQSEPAKLLRIIGVAPLRATVYERERLRCNLCGEVYTAPSPEGVGEEKYDATATSMVGLLKYGVGMPFNRIEKLQDGLKIPLPASTQWDLVEAAAKKFVPAHEELLNQAAQGTVVYNDDTTM